MTTSRDDLITKWIYARTHLVQDAPANAHRAEDMFVLPPDGRNAQPRLRKLLRFRIRKTTQNRGNQNQIVNNILNLSLDYLSWDGRQTTLNFDPGQYQISFIASVIPVPAVGLAGNFGGGPSGGGLGPIMSNVLFDLSDFSENEITYQSFFDSHNIAAAPSQFI